MICLIAHEQHWCLESDLFYAAGRRREGDKSGVVSVSKKGKSVRATSDAHAETRIHLDKTKRREDKLKAQSEAFKVSVKEL